jgi:mannosyltransferase OCH1-like enzyme
METNVPWAVMNHFHQQVSTEGPGMDINVIRARLEAELLSATITHPRQHPTSPSIPPKIHQMWLDKNDPTSKNYPAKYQDYVKSWTTNNPEFQYRLWNVDEFRNLCSRYPHYLEFFDKIPTWISKCDFARVVVLFDEGGLYVDLDFKCLKNIAPILVNQEIFLGRCVPEEEALLGTGAINNNIMGSTVGHPFMKGWLDYMVKHYNWDEPKNVMCNTGPIGLFTYYQQSPLRDTVRFQDQALCFPTNYIDPFQVQPSCKNRECFAYNLWKEGTNWPANL